MAVVPLEHRHIRAVARLVAAEVADLRRAVPLLPPAWPEADAVAPALARLIDRGEGLAVEDAGELLAFQAALILDRHPGRWAYTPDIGHAAPGASGDRHRERLYAALAERWVRDGCHEHVITIAAHDHGAQEAMGRLGFGQLVIDLVGSLAPADPGPLPPGLAVRRAGPADAAAVAELDAGLRRHLRASPIFLRQGPAADADELLADLADPSSATFLAERDGHAVAHLRIGPCATDVATVVRDPSTASVTAAFTVPELRGSGIASHLLAAAIGWAQAAGYQRWAVDHESANREAGRFWARHAAPVAVSMARRLAP